MLGSAIPRRWIFSIALVGLVSIFAVSYSAVWSSPAFADSEGAGTGTGNGNPLDPDQILDTASTLPTGLVMNPGSQTQVSVDLIDANGDVSDSLPAVTFSWSAGSNSNVTIVGSTATATAIFQANAVGSTTFTLTITQIQQNRDWIVQRQITINVQGAVATSTPAPLPGNPGPVPGSIPNARAVIQPAAASLVSTSGVESGGSAQNRSFSDRPVVYVRNGSITDFYGLNIDSVDPAGLAPMPSRYVRGSSAVDIHFVNQAGVKQNNFRINRAAEICLPTTASDRANGGVNVKLLRFSSTSNGWVELNSTYNNITRQVCGNSSNFSTFAIGVLQVQPTPGPGGPVIPATGGWSPTSGLLLFAGLLGFVLVGGGAVTMRRVRNARSEQDFN